MKTILVAFVLLAVQAEAKVLVVVSDAEMDSPISGVNLYEISTVISKTLYQGKISADFVTPSGGPIVISGQSVDSKYYSEGRLKEREVQIQLFQSAFGRILFNKTGVSPSTKRLLDAVDGTQDQQERVQVLIPSLKGIVENNRLDEYDALIVIGGVDAVEYFPRDSDFQSTMLHFHEKNKTIALAGYALAALTTEGASIFTDYVVAAVEPSQKAAKRLDSRLLASGIIIRSSVDDDFIATYREVLSAQQGRAIGKLLEAFIDKISASDRN